MTSIDEIRSEIEKIIYKAQDDYFISLRRKSAGTDEIMKLITPYICMIGDCRCNNAEDWSSK